MNCCRVRDTEMKKPVMKTIEVTEKILDEISVGKTLTSICKCKGMPTIQAVMKWCREDKELDDDMHRARIRGTLIQADEAVDAQRAVIHGKIEGNPKHIQAVVTAANNMGHQANAKLSKIDNRYKDKQQVEHTGPIVVGWDESPKVAEDKKPDALSELTTLAAAGGEAIEHCAPN